MINIVSKRASLRLIRVTLRSTAAIALVTALGGAASAAEPIVAIPLSVEADGKKVALGRKLFNDTRLSKDGTISCSSCHVLAKGGADGLQVSVGVGGAKGFINALIAIFGTLSETLKHDSGEICRYRASRHQTAERLCHARRTDKGRGFRYCAN